jgi:DNA repair ATPase RecN
VVLAIQLPGRSEVHRASARVEKVGRGASREVHRLRQQLQRVRDKQPELLALARRLEQQMRTIGNSVRSRDFSGDGLADVSDALGNVAGGLDTLSEGLDAKDVDQLAKGLGAMAEYLDAKVVPGAEKAARALEQAGGSLKSVAGKLKAFLDETPLELKAARAMVDSLTKFEEGLERMAKVAEVKNFETMREGFKGLETSLDSGADQVEKVADYTIPKVTVKGLRISVEDKDFWPEGKTIAEGMRKGAKGCAAAGKEMDVIKKELPKLKQSLDQSRKVVTATRKALTQALEGQEKLEPVLKSLPRSLSKLSQELPNMTTELAKVLRETSRLKEVAAGLRDAEKGISSASKRWPALRGNLTKSAELLRATRKQIRHVLSHREEFEKTIQQTAEVSILFAGALPALLEEMGEDLDKQEESLTELGQSIESVTESVAPAAESASNLLVTTRVLLCLVAMGVSLHSASLLRRNNQRMKGKHEPGDGEDGPAAQRSPAQGDKVME